MATAVAGIVAPILTSWLLHIGGGHELSIEAVFALPLVGAFARAFLLRQDWADALAARTAIA